MRLPTLRRREGAAKTGPAVDKIGNGSTRPTSTRPETMTKSRDGKAEVAAKAGAGAVGAVGGEGAVVAGGAVESGSTTTKGASGQPADV